VSTGFLNAGSLLLDANTYRRFKGSDDYLRLKVCHELYIEMQC